MSGPIIRKYGFPNFEQIFGQREPAHGAGDARPDQAAAPRAPLDSETPGHSAPVPASDPEATPPTSNADDPTGRATETKVDPTTSFGNAVG